MSIFNGWFVPWFLHGFNNSRIDLHISPEVRQLVNGIGLIKNVTQGEYILTNMIFYSDSYIDRHPLTGRVLTQFKGPFLKLCGDTEGTWFYYEDINHPVKYGSGELSLVKYLQQLKESHANL